jgi:site-specific recombinase XerD
MPLIRTKLPAPIEPKQKHSVAAFENDFADALEFARASHAASTLRAYNSDFRVFAAWCETRKVCTTPATAEIVAAFLAYEAKRNKSASTIARRVAAIRHIHLIAGHSPPTSNAAVQITLKGIRRKLGIAPKQKVPILAAQIQKMANAAPNTLQGKRDRALLLLGFAGALRRSELVGLDVSDLKICKQGLKIKIRRSKTDQDGRSELIAIPIGRAACPVAAVRNWTEAAKIKHGPLFRSVRKDGRASADRLSDRSIPDILKRFSKIAGLDPRTISGHSLRSGFLTSAASCGASIFKLRDVSRHRSLDSLSKYVRDAEIFRDSAASRILYNSTLST